MSISRPKADNLLRFPALADRVRDFGLALALTVLQTALISTLKGFHDDPISGLIASEKALKSLLRVGRLLGAAGVAVDSQAKARNQASGQAHVVRSPKIVDENDTPERRTRQPERRCPTVSDRSAHRSCPGRVCGRLSSLWRQRLSRPAHRTGSAMM